MKKYVYNEDGIRTSKTVNGVKTTFLLDGYNVINQTDGTTILHFFYDSNGKKNSKKTIKKAIRKIGREYEKGQIEDFGYGGIYEFSSFYARSVVNIF